VQLMMEQCLYCQQPFPSHELADHITLNHVCNQCGRKFRQPANLLKVRVNHYDFMSVYWHMHNLLLIKLELWKSMINCVINDFRIVYCYGFTNWDIKPVYSVAVALLMAWINGNATTHICEFTYSTPS